MRARHSARQAERVQRNAELCGIPLEQWTALTRMERRRLLRAAKKEGGDVAPNPLECDGGTVGGSFPTACGRDHVHASHPLGQPPVTDATPNSSCPSCGSVTRDGPILGRKAIDKGDGPEWCDDDWHDQAATDAGSSSSGGDPNA